MSGITKIQSSAPQLSILDNRISRHTIGRVDAIFRTAIYAWAIAVQSVKLVLKCAVCVLTLGQLSKTFSFGTLLVDTAFLGALFYRIATAVRDVLVAPKVGYVSSPKKLIETIEHTLSGKYYEILEERFEDLSAQKKAQKLMNATLKSDPFFVFTD